MDVVELWSGSTKALVSIDGAWLTNLSDDRGDILYPKRTLTTPDGGKKTRGGMHVCLPNFGPGGDSGLAQHGFGRTSLWEVTSQSIDRVTLRLKGGADDYQGLVSTLSYVLADESLTATLAVENTGATDLRVAPGFHPYFSLQDGEGSVMLDSNGTDLDDLAGTMFVDGTTRQLKTNRRTFTLHSAELVTWAIWTDRLAPYVCVEPTVAGNAFLQSVNDRQLLRPGQIRSYEARIAW